MEVKQFLIKVAAQHKNLEWAKQEKNNLRQNYQFIFRLPASSRYKCTPMKYSEYPNPWNIFLEQP